MDLEKARKHIQEIRKNQNLQLLERFAYLPIDLEDLMTAHDGNAWDRMNLILALFEDYNHHDKPLIRWFVQQEILAQEALMPYYALDLAAFMLLKYCSNSDLDLLFDAKFCIGNIPYLDAELLFGRDVNETLTYFEEHKNNHINYKLNQTIIKEYLAIPDVIFRNHEDYINYFENQKIKIVKNDLFASEEFYKKKFRKYFKNKK